MQLLYTKETKITKNFVNGAPLIQGRQYNDAEQNGPGKRAGAVHLKAPRARLKRRDLQFAISPASGQLPLKANAAFGTTAP